MKAGGPHIIVEDLRIGWGARVLMEHVSFAVARGAVLRYSAAPAVARVRCCDI